MALLQQISTALNWRVSRYQKFARQRLVRLDNGRVREALVSLGGFRSDYLLVHSSLSALGNIQGGARTLVEALLAWVSGHALSMPTFTYCYPDRTGKAPVFEVATTPSVVGVVTDYFWRQPNVVRSLHPTHSLACVGPGSLELCKGHELTDTPCGSGTPFQRLVERDCGVLMFGATMDTYTLFHTAEDEAQVPYLYEPQPYVLKTKDQRSGVLSVTVRR